MTIYPILDGVMTKRSDTPASIHSLAAFSPLCTADGSGPCGNMQAWATRRSRIGVTNTSSRTAPWDCLLLSICLHKSDTTRMIPCRREKLEGLESQLTPLKTC